MNSNNLKFIFKIAQNIQCKNVYRPILSVHYLSSQLCYNNIQQKLYSSGANSFSVKELSFFDDIKQKIKLQFQKNKLSASGYYLYESIADQLDYNAFITELDMPDTFNSWFLITELHVWMMMARLMGEPRYGRFVRNIIVEALWKDVSLRAKKLGPEHISVIKTQITNLSEEFQAALVNYDEGILSDDVVLAGALWRRLLNRNCTPRQLEAMVKYVRQMMFLMDKLSAEELLTRKRLKWIPLTEVLKTVPP